MVGADLKGYYTTKCKSTLCRILYLQDFGNWGEILTFKKRNSAPARTRACVGVCARVRACVCVCVIHQQPAFHYRKKSDYKLVYADLRHSTAQSNLSRVSIL